MTTKQPKRSVRRTLASVAVATMAATGAVVATAGSADAAICGQYVYNKTLYYSHCGTRNVEIRVFEFLDIIPEYRCVAPGTNYIGPAWRYLDASSTRRSC